MQDTVGHEAYGVFAALFSLSFLFATLSDLGVNQYVTKRLAGEPDKVDEIYPAALGLKLLLLFLYPVGMTIVGFTLGYEMTDLYYLWLLSFFQGGVQLVLFLRANFQAHQNFFVDSFASVLDKLLLIFFLLVLFQIHITVENFIYARLLSMFVAVAVLYFVYATTYGWDKPTVKLNRITPIIRQSIPFAMITVLYSFNERVDQVMVERLLGGVSSGLYAGAYRWLDAIMMYLWIVLPLFFARFAFLKNNRPLLDRTFRVGHVIAFLPMAFVSGFVFMYPEKFFLLFQNSTPEEIRIMSDVLKILFVAAVVNGLFAIYSTLLTSIGYEKQTSVMILISVGLNLALNIIFIPMYGINASACATVSSTILLSFSYAYYLHTKNIITIPFVVIFKLSLAFTLFMLFFYGLSTTTMEWYVNTLLAALFLALVSWLLGLLQFKETVSES